VHLPEGYGGSDGMVANFKGDGSSKNEALICRLQQVLYTSPCIQNLHGCPPRVVWLLRLQNIQPPQAASDYNHQDTYSAAKIANST
jgi:hypothetical protein